MTSTLCAAGGLQVAVGADGALRVGFGHPDWFGPGGLSVQARAVPCAVGELSGGRDGFGEFTAGIVARDDVGVTASVRAYRDLPLVVFSLSATRELEGLQTGSLERPSVSWPHLRPKGRAADGVPAGTTSFAHQYTEFAVPVAGSDDLTGLQLFPHRPAVVAPLWLVAPDGRALMLAPLDAFHDQVIAVGGVDGAECGWHGDLETVPAGFTTQLALIAGDSARGCLQTWGELVRAHHGTAPRSRFADTLNRQLSYWTDNGAAYWYRTAAGRDVPTTLSDTTQDLRTRGVPIGAVQLDSWFYPHEVLRPFDTAEWGVPPTGLATWEPRPDVLPDGLDDLTDRLDRPPLVLHCRHLSSASPYLQQYPCWIDGDRAHPQGPELYQRWLDQAVAWGAETFEHDWLIDCYLGVRQLRAMPGRARAWQEGINAAARERGLTLQWCMPTPADYFQTVTLGAVSSVRTSGDFGYLVGPAFLWAWFLHTNALARALGLNAFKDVFRSGGDGPDDHADIECLLSALSAGPVGVGDALGAADPAQLARTHRADGMLVKPDAPVAAVDSCYRSSALVRRTLVTGETFTRHPAGTWHYVVSINCHHRKEASAEVSASDLPGLVGRHVVWNWRNRTLSVPPGPMGGWTTRLGPLAWDYRVLAPVLPGDIAVVGDPERWVTAGDTRLSVSLQDDAVACTVLGAGESVRLVGWSREPVTASLWTPTAEAPLPVERDAEGLWSVTVAVPPTGWCVLRLTPPAGG